MDLETGRCAGPASTTASRSVPTARRSDTARSMSPRAGRDRRPRHATGDELWSTPITATETDGVDIQPTGGGRGCAGQTVPISLDGQFQRRRPRTHLGARRRDGQEGVDLRHRSGAPTCGAIRAVNSGGGAWYPPAVDPNGGWSTGARREPGALPRHARASPKGSSRPGTQPLHQLGRCAATSGPASWRGTTRASPHDIFDHDLQLAAIARVAGRTVGRARDGDREGRSRVASTRTGRRRSDTPVGDHRTTTPASFTVPPRSCPVSSAGS